MTDDAAPILAALLALLVLVATGFATYASILRRKILARRAWIDTADVAAGLLKPGDPFMFGGDSFRTSRNVPEGVYGIPLRPGGIESDAPDLRIAHTQTVSILLGWGLTDETS